MASFNDVYNSIINGGGIPGKATPATLGRITSSFIPGQYGRINSQIASRNPSNYTDVPSLNRAVRAGLINQSQWMKQFKIIQAKQQPNPKIDTSIKGNLNPFSGQSALGQSLNKVFIQSPKNAVVDTKNAVVNQAKYLSGPTSTQGQRNAIINNQKKSATNPAYSAAVKSFKPGANSASGLIQAQKMAAGGAKTPQIKSFLRQDAQAMTGQQNKAINVLANVAGLSVPGEGIIAKTIGPKLGAALGKDEAVNNLIKTVRTAQAADAASKTATIGGSVVKEAKTTHIPVTEPTVTKIPVEGKSTQVMGKVTTASDSKYIKASNKLSAQYEKDLGKIQKVPRPVTQQVLQRQLDAKYNALQEKLDSSYGKSSIDFKGKPTIVKTVDTLPKSALNREPPTPFNSTRIPIQETPSPAPGKSPAKTVTSVTEKNKTAEAGQGSTKATPVTTEVAGTKVSGSALRTEQKAVETGMQGELGGKATYDTVSHKAEAANAVKLVHEDPQQALEIAMGRQAGNNASHEAAVYHAVANDALTQAKKTGDYSRVAELASSPRHTGVSEAAQKLGAEGYNLDVHDPVRLMAKVSKARQAAVEARKGTTVAKETANVTKEVKQAMPKISRQDWHSFVESLACK